MANRKLQVIKAIENEDKLAKDFECVFIESPFTAEEIERSIEAEKRLGIDKLPCVFLSDANSQPY